MMPRTSRNSGYTLTEIMATVVIIGVVAAVAIPKLSKRTSNDAKELARIVSSALQTARIRAVSTQRPYRVSIDPKSVTTMYSTDNGATWLTERIQPPPPAAGGTSQHLGQIWGVTSTASPNSPTSPTNTGHTVRFNPNFTVIIDEGSNNWLSAHIYVANDVDAVQGRRYLITVIGSGAVRQGDQWP